jgi:tetratricopeptide (TPR) repeat protein
MEVNDSTLFKNFLQKAADLLKCKKQEDSFELISKAISINMDAPEPHNLLGILMEIRGNDSVARKHYRAAYALDPTYKPACRNLERLVNFEWGPQNRNYDFGEFGDEDSPNEKGEQRCSVILKIKKSKNWQ